MSEAVIESEKDKINELVKALDQVKQEMNLNDELVSLLKKEIESSNKILETNGKLIQSIKKMVIERKSITPAPEN